MRLTKYKIGGIDHTIDNLVLSYKPTTSINGSTAFATEKNIIGIPELIINDNVNTTTQFKLVTKSTVSKSTSTDTDITVIPGITRYYLTNLIYTSTLPMGQSKTHNLMIDGTFPDWTIKEWDDTNGYKIKQDQTDKNKWLIGDDGTIKISTINAIPVSGYGSDLDVGVPVISKYPLVVSDPITDEKPSGTPTSKSDP